jgi:hypothetical protein
MSYPEYLEIGGVYTIPQEARANLNRQYHTSILDLIYTGMNVKVILFKPSLPRTHGKVIGNFALFSDNRKYYDSILFGTKDVNESSPQEFHTEINSMLRAYKKETAKEREIVSPIRSLSPCVG